MIYLRYMIIVTALSLSFVSGGIINVQTSIPTEYTKAKERLKSKEEGIEKEITSYRDEIKKNNEALKRSIEKLKAVIEVKKNTLIVLKYITVDTKNTKNITKDKQ